MANTGPKKSPKADSKPKAGDRKVSPGSVEGASRGSKSKRSRRRSGKRQDRSQGSKTSAATTRQPDPQPPLAAAAAGEFRNEQILCGPEMPAEFDLQADFCFSSDTVGFSRHEASLQPNEPTKSAPHPECPPPPPPTDQRVISELQTLRTQLLEELKLQFADLREGQNEAFEHHETLVRRTWQKIRRQFRNPVPAPSPDSTQSSSASPTAPQPANPANDSTPLPAAGKKKTSPAAEDSENRSWEQIRREYLDNCGEDEFGADSEDEGTDSPAAPPEVEKKQDAADALLAEIDLLNRANTPAMPDVSHLDNLPDLQEIQQRMASSLHTVLDCIPAPVSAENLDNDQIRDELVMRDEYIARMVRACRQLEEHRSPILTTDQMRTLTGAMPEESHKLFREAVNRIDELHRMNEMEMSFERARLARERIVLQKVRQRLESSAGQMGMVLNEDGSLSRMEDNPDQPGNMRWLRKLGLASKDQTRG